jgi:uncharacterized protein YprB with RNaseH-like and TPR domain
MNQNLLFLDTETTGLDAEDRLVEVGYASCRRHCLVSANDSRQQYQ